MSAAEDEPKKRKADVEAIVQCMGCGKSLAKSAVYEECASCFELFCRVCYDRGSTRRCAFEGCTVVWCLPHFARAGNRCIMDQLVCDSTHVCVEDHAMFCSKHSVSCVQCRVAICNLHNEEEKKSRDWFEIHTAQCGRCQDYICRACSVECSQCEERECFYTCEKIRKWEDESGKTKQDYFCQKCRHVWRREGDADESDTEI